MERERERESTTEFWLSSFIAIPKRSESDINSFIVRRIAREKKVCVCGSVVNNKGKRIQNETSIKQGKLPKNRKPESLKEKKHKQPTTNK